VQDVYEEVDALLRRQGISKYRAKPVNRNYAFEEPDVPREPTEYLKVKYDANLGKLQSDCSGRTFSHIFGTNISPLERFLMKRDLMGPCWLRIKGATCVQQPYSWCKVEAVVDNAKNIFKVEAQKPSPPLTVLSISMQTILNRKTHTNEVCKSGEVGGGGGMREKPLR
jgi:DNA polymerase alpha subunit A